MGVLEGKVALVTGAGRQGSLGFAVARALAAEGATVALTGCSKAQASACAGQLQRECGVAALPLAFDGFSASRAEGLVEQVAGELGRIDVLVNCGAYAKGGAPLAETQPADLERSLEAGLVSCFAFMRACRPHLQASGAGSVINFATGSAACGQAGAGALAAAKEGLRALSRVAATEWGPEGITVNVVCPLAHNAQLAKWAGEFPAEYDEVLAGIPLGRFGDACADVGRTCVFLAGPDARYLTGQTLYLQGGLNLRP